MQRKYPGVRFERYADDAIVHCRSEEEARSVLDAIRGRLAECGLELQPEKTRVVYCKDDDRRGKHEHVKFDFLGYTFQPRRAKNRFRVRTVRCDEPWATERRAARDVRFPGLHALLRKDPGRTVLGPPQNPARPHDPQAEGTAARIDPASAAEVEDRLARVQRRARPHERLAYRFL